MTTNQPLSLFISSKMAELAAERKAIQAALSEYDMHGWLWEKDAGARPEPIDSTYLAEVEACDLYIGLFWLGYGPYTIEEYEHARKHHKDCLVYEKYTDLDKRDPRLQAFLDNIQQVKNPEGLTVARFETAKQLADRVKKDVIHLLTTRYRNTRKQPPASSGKRWHPPKPPAFDKAFIGRQNEVDKLFTRLSAGHDVTLTGKTTSATFQGMAGIGKTYLARKLATELQNFFTGGVIWIEIGPQVTDEASAQIPLRRLASHIPEGIQPTGQLYPEQVATLIEEMAPGRILAIFDDVWHQAPLRFLVRALPANAVRLITTRYANVAQTLGGEIIRLDRLIPEDGLALLEDRLDCHSDATYKDDLEKLVILLDGHALALDIAAAQIKKRSSRIQAVPMVLNNLRQGIGRGQLNSLTLPPSEERDENLEKSLALSYERMTAEQQHRFRILGVFAAEAPIPIEAAAAVWGMNNLSEAQNELFELVDLTLLTEIEEKSAISYRQHGLLRVYALALLGKNRELSSASRMHAQYYTDMAGHIDVANYLLLDQHTPNLLAALEWTIDNEPVMFSEILNSSFYFLQVRGQSKLLEIYLPKAVAAAVAVGNKGRQANLLMRWGNLENQLGNPDQARAHYDNALPLYQAERNLLGQANLLHCLGELEMQRDNINQAEANYKNSLFLYQRQQEHLGEAHVLKSLGNIKIRRGDIDQARNLYDAALHLYHTEGDRLGEANVLHRLGMLERQQGQQDKFELAYTYYNTALHLYRAEHYSLGEAKVYASFADMLMAQNEWQQARTYSEQALKLFVTEREPLGQANSLRILGCARYALGEYESGMQAVQQSAILFRSIQNKDWAQRVERELSEMRRRLEDPE